MMRLLSKQKVEDDSGFIVQVTSRTSIEYIEQYFKAVAAVEFGVHVAVYRASLSGFDSLSHPVFLTPEKRQQILVSIVHAIKTMGSEAVIC